MGRYSFSNCMVTGLCEEIMATVGWNPSLESGQRSTESRGLQHYSSPAVLVIEKIILIFPSIFRMWQLMTLTWRASRFSLLSVHASQNMSCSSFYFLFYSFLKGRGWGYIFLSLNYTAALWAVLVGSLQQEWDFCFGLPQLIIEKNDSKPA